MSTAETMAGTFQREDVRTLWPELTPLLQKHWREIAHYQDIPLNVDFETYERLEGDGSLRVFTARSKEWELIGYAIYFLRHNLHYLGSFQALQDVLFLLPEHRKTRIGSQLIDWADERLRDDGVQVVIHHVKAAHNFGPLLERKGYELQDLIYTKRLDK